MTHESVMHDATFESYRYLCRRGARKFVRRGLDRTDLEQVAAIGLIKACRRYDASKRTPFEAFAWIMIVGELMHHVRDFEHAVRLPRWIRSLERRYVGSVERLTQRLEREPSDAEISVELNVPPHVVGEVKRAERARVYERLDAVGAQAQPFDPFDRLLVQRALEAVEPVSRAVVIGIYALGLSRSEIAHRAGLTVRQVTRAHDAALAKMRLELAS